MARLTPSKQLNDLLISKNFDPQLLNREGKPALNAEDAEVFSFDYIGTSGKDYGTVAILMGDDSNMDVYFGNNLGKGMEAEDKKGWFDFLLQLRHFAKRNLQSFGVADLNKLKYSMQGQAAIKEGLFESWRGTSTQSWTRYPNDVKLVIRHSRPLSENDKRYRYVQALFLETAEGERFKLPFTKLAGGRAMVEHVRQGGKPYDIRGQHISEMVGNINLLSQFKRASRNQIFEGDTATLVEQATQYYESIKKNLGSLSSTRGYKRYFESWQPQDINKEELIIEDIKGLFVTQQLDTRIEQALPLLAKLQQENNMKELSIFEGYLNCISEGTWALPDTEQKQQELIKLLSEELPVGADATNATEQLYNLLGDDDLFNQLEDLAREDSNADARTIIVNRLEQMKSNPNIAQVIGKLSVESAPEPVETEADALNNSSNQERGQIEEDYSAVANVKELAQQYMVDFGYYDASEFQPEEIEMLASDAQVGVQDVCDILGIKCPANLEEHGSGVENMKGKSWQSSKAGAHPWNANESEELDEGSMKEAMWRDAERMERAEFCEKWGDEHGEFWDNIMGDLDEGIKGAIAGGLAGAALTKTPAGAIRGAQIGDKLGDMVSENLTWEPKSKAGEVTAENFGEMTKDELFAADLARMKSLAMIK